MEKTTISFKTIQIINGALIFGVLIFLMITFFLTKDPSFIYNDDSVFAILVPISLMLGAFLSSLLFKKQLQTIKKEENLQYKLGKYQSATIVRSALLEAPALLGIVATFITFNLYYLIFAGIALLLMVYNFPSKDKFTQDINLSFEEKTELNNL